jgi:hypothetical protein
MIPRLFRNGYRTVITAVCLCLPTIALADKVPADVRPGRADLPQRSAPLPLQIAAADDAELESEKPGIMPVEPKKDEKTGFVVGGKNATSLIEKLTELNGRTIEELEADMRPGAKSAVSSTAGFLGADESLLAILAADNRYVVDELGLTHQELAKHLHVLGALAVDHTREAIKAGRRGAVKEVTYQGRKFSLEAQLWRGVQRSPFKDGTNTNADAIVTNVETGKVLKFSLLVPHMIERYGFYEGKGTPYRVDPKQVLEVLDFLQPKRGGK